MERRRKVKEQGLNTADRQLSYQQLTRNINAGSREDKNAYITSICQEIEAHYSRAEPRDLFRKVKLLTKDFHSRLLPVKDDRGVILTNKPEILERWRQYCQTLMANKDARDGESTQTRTGDIEPSILRSEVIIAMGKLKNKRSERTDGIVTEMLVATGESRTDVLHEICNKIWESGRWPNEWKETVYIPLHKKGCKKDCGNYRTIAVRE